MKRGKLNYALKSSFVGMIAGVCVQYIVEVVIKLMKKSSIIESLKVNGTWQAYYTAGIAGGINGFLLVFLPPKLYSFSSIMVVVAVYNALLYFTSEEELEENLTSSNDFVFGIIRDIFLIYFIVYIFGKISSFTSKKSIVKKEELPFTNLLGTTIISSIIISLSFNYTQNSLNAILGFTNSLDEAITEWKKAWF